VRSALPSKREARVFFGFHDGMLIALACRHQKDAENASRRVGAREAEIEGGAVMARKNPHIGSSFESWLDESGIRAEVTAAATKAVIARQLASEMKKKKITKQRMAELMKTSRAQVDRLLDPDNGSATIESLQRAARIVGRQLRLQLI
jgi:antitoxin HicB